ncbi:hypothetical protein ACFPT7_02230 [Acidicapsa dinghuensis]|uniref:Uncharacterized protein n=1 Tax=Acidicapsa dinghuensis TaxID=2218256 RepID=A0ABW1EDP8_9BACT|nr:hypothetical protein [Acidicapsa dinghuensis]
MNVDPEFLQESIVEEVAKQLKPFDSRLAEVRKDVKNISEWKDEVYANGSGKKQGYFERARREDKDRWDEIQGLLEQKNRESIEADIRKKIAEENSAKHKRHFDYLKLVIEFLSISGVWAFLQWLANHRF